MNHDSRPYDSLPHDSLPHDQRRARRPNTTKKLTRSRYDRVLTGVLGGVAAYVGANPTTVRLLFALSTLLSGGILAVGYLLLWWLLPQGHA
jgi:phage shock protein C